MEKLEVKSSEAKEDWARVGCAGAKSLCSNPLLHTEIHVAVVADYDRTTFDAAVGKLLPDMSDKVRACIKRNEWMLE